MKQGLQRGMTRNLILGAFACVAIAIVGCKPTAPVGPRTPFRRYGVAHAHIHYLYSGFARGSEDLYFDNYGEREARKTDYERIEENKFTPVQSTSIQIGSEFWMLSDARHEGSHFFNKEFDSIMSLNRDSNFTPQQASVSMLMAQGSKSLGMDTVLGLQTHVWKMSMADNTLYIWKGILLKSESRHGDEHVSIAAVSIDTTTPLDPAIFSIPHGYDIQDGKPPGR